MANAVYPCTGRKVSMLIILFRVVRLVRTIPWQIDYYILPVIADAMVDHDGRSDGQFSR